MTNSTPQHEHTQLNTSHIVSSLSDEFLSLLVDELNTENVTALALVGSYAHGDATPYSDIDVLCFVHEAPEHTRRYVYRDGRLIGISTRTIAQYRKRFTVPEEAIFVVPSIRV
jgi:predicted nucleotidyltransferase